MELIFEKSVEGRRGYYNPSSDVEVQGKIPSELMRQKDCRLPEVSELDVVRHFSLLSKMNFSLDTNFYPLGSCTMKYNPKFTENIAQIPGFSELHPLLPQLRHGEKFTQGALEVLFDMEKLLSEITGMDSYTLQPLAGAHGELTGVMIMAAYHKAKGNKKKYILVPDSSHGTNPATSATVGYETISIPSNSDGVMDINILKEKLSDEVAGLMITSPNTHGIFNSDIDEIAELVHSVDGVMYYDGANFNAVMGRCRPGDIGFDIVHLNLHKTFATPHGGGGPGSGPVGVKEHLSRFLPISRIEKKQDGTFFLNYDYPESIGYVASLYGNFSVILKAYAYILLCGKEGLKQVSNHAVLNANYIKEKLKEFYEVAFDRTCMHECVFSAENQAKLGVHAVDIAKYLIDQGIHPPTVYFPLTVKESIMIEPTETESKRTMDTFIEAMVNANEQVKKDAESFKTLPKTTPVTRPDEVLAARELKINYFEQNKA